MRHVIRSAADGVVVSKAEMERRRLKAVEQVLGAGKEYLTYNAMLGSRDGTGTRIEEHVIVVEELDDVSYP